MTKDELRASQKKVRSSIPPEEKKALDASIVERILSSDLFRSASSLLLFVPLEGEVGILPLAREARKLGKPIAFPRCDKQTTTMRFYCLGEGERLSPGAYGIPEPPPGSALCEPDAHALCILPGLSFDASGNRLGYGKGYYDRFLATFPGVTLGAVYGSMLLPEVPHEDYDVPCQWIVTEKELFPTSPSSKKSPEPAPPSRSFFSARVVPFLSSVGSYFAKAVKDRGAPHAPVSPPLLVLSVFILLLFSRFADSRLLDRGSAAVGVVFLELLIFLIPSILYCRLRGEKFLSRIRMRLIRPEHLFFVLCVLVMMISGGLLCGILTGGISSLGGSFVLYGIFVARTGGVSEILTAVLAYAVLPAFCEELVFRSLLCAEYECFGAGVAVTVSALFYAMLHFSFPYFLTYFVLGLFLAFAMYATRSFLAPVVLHLCYNLFCLFGQPYLSAFYVNAGSNEIFLFVLIVVFLLFSAFCAGEARKIYHILAKRNADMSYTVELPLREYPRSLIRSVRTPVCAVCLIFWLVMAVINL